MRINFDLVDLQAFSAVYESGSFYSAAEGLGLSQSAISRRIAKLEKALGADLFLRTTRDVRPTLAGKRLKLRAESILAETSDMVLSIRDDTAHFAHQMARTLTVAAIPTVIPGILAPALKQLLNNKPEARFRLLDGDANAVADAVDGGEAELGLCSVPLAAQNTTFTFLYDDPILLALPVGHRLAQKTAVTWADVTSETLILPDRRTGNRTLISDALARRGHSLNWTVEVNRTNTAVECVIAGMGLAPLPASAVDAGRQGAVIYRPLVDPVVSRPIGLLSKNGQVARPGVNDLIRAIHRVLEQRHASDL